MKYCKKCKRLVFTEKDVCECGKKLIDNPDTDLPCTLMTSDETSCAAVEAALTKEEIPYSDVMSDKVQPIFGAVSGQHTFYVPICFMKKAIDALVDVNVMEQPDYYYKLEISDEPVWEDMSPSKRNIVRVLSVIAFAAAVYLCVTGVDYAAAFIKGLFK